MKRLIKRICEIENIELDSSFDWVDKLGKNESTQQEMNKINSENTGAFDIKASNKATNNDNSNNNDQSAKKI